MPVVEAVVSLRAIVDSHQVLHGGEAGVEPTAIHGAADRTGRVVLMDYLHHGGEEARPFRRALQPFLVAHGPHDDAGMIAIPQDHARQVAQVRIRRSRGGVVAVGVAQMPVFVHHQHAQLVAGVQQFGVGRIVRHAPGIVAHLLKFLTRHCSSESGTATPTPAKS